MKKSLIALAVLAASGAAMAQSSVTLYGIADVFVGYDSVDDGKTDTSNTVLNSGGVNTSRWGIKGSEDLGGGLKANFDFQQGFAMDSGAASTGNELSCAAGECLDSKGKDTKAGLAFARQSWVGLSGGFGATRLGRTTTPYDDVNGTSNTLFDSNTLSPFNNIASSTKYNARPNNTFYYQAPDMSGFSGAFSYSLAESSTADDTYSLNLTYAGGPFKAQLAYQFEGEDTGWTATSPLADGPAEKQFTRIGASYAFGALTLKGTFGRVENAAGIEDKNAAEWQLGLDYVMGPWVFTGGYAQSDIDSYTNSKNAVVADESRKGFGLGAAYTLSKRTYVYGGYETDTMEGGTRTADRDHSVFALGVNHKF